MKQWKFKKGERYMTKGNYQIIVQNAGTVRMIAAETSLRANRIRIYLTSGVLSGTKDTQEQNDWEIDHQITPKDYPELFI